MRLRDLIRDRALDLSVIVGPPAALEAEIHSAYVTDLPDPARFVGPGTVVLSSGLWTRSPGGVRRFLDALADRGAGALVLGLVELGSVPPEVVHGCRTRGLPLVTTGDEVSFASIVEAVRAGQDDGRRFADRIAAALGEGPLSDALDLAAAQLGVRCWVSDESGAITPEAPTRLWARVLGQAGGADEAARAEPIAVWRLAECADGLTPLLLAELGADAGAARTGLATLAFVLGPELRLAARLRAHRRTHTRQLVEAAVAGSLPTAELSVLSRLLGLEPGRAVWVVALDAPDLPPAARVGLAARLTGSTVAADVGDRAVVLTHGPTGTHPDSHPGTDDVPELLRRQASERIAREAPVQVRMAVSDPVPDLDLLGPAVTATVNRLVRARGPGRLVFAGRAAAGSHRDLLALLSPAAREAFVHGALDPLVRYDRKHGTDLLHTLRVFLDSGGAWQEAARLLQVHPNTLRYRIGRVETLTDRDLSSMPDRVDLFLALTCQQD